MSVYNQRNIIFKQFGSWLMEQSNAIQEELLSIITRQYESNAWLIPEFAFKEMQSCAHFLLHELEDILLPEVKQTGKVGLIIFQNIPLAGFRETVLLLALNQEVWIRDDDKNFILLKYLLEQLIASNPDLKNRINFINTFSREIDSWVFICDKREDNPSLIKYLSTKRCLTVYQPESLIRLNGTETDAQLELLASNIFTYWGFHANNIRKLIVPQGYSFNRFFEVAEKFSFVYNYNRYANNYDYHKSVYLMDRKPFLDNGFLVVYETSQLTIPVGCLGYQYEDTTGTDLDVSHNYLKSIDDLSDSVPGIGANSFFTKVECLEIIQFINKN